MNKDLLSCIEIELSTPIVRSIIWLHGLGADGSDFVPIVSLLSLPPTSHVRFIFPHARIIPITLNQGQAMRAWYDIAALDARSIPDHIGIARSVSAIEQLIEKEVARGIKTSHIMLAGFSQGALIALATGLCYPKPLFGIIALSGYLPLADQILKKASVANRHIPIFLAHGTKDPIVPYALGKTTYMALRQAGYPISWHTYPIAHTVCETQISDLSEWLQDLIRLQESSPNQQ